MAEHHRRNLTAGLQTLKNMKIKVKKCASVVKSVVLGELRVTLVLTVAHSQRDSEFAFRVCVWTVAMREVIPWLK